MNSLTQLAAKASVPTSVMESILRECITTEVKVKYEWYEDDADYLTGTADVTVVFNTLLYSNSVTWSMDLSDDTVSSLELLKGKLGKASINEELNQGLNIMHYGSGERGKSVSLYIDYDRCGLGCNHSFQDVTIPTDTFSQVLDSLIEECRKKFAIP